MTITGEQTHGVAMIASTVRRRGYDVTWQNLELVVSEEALQMATGRGPVIIERALSARLLGRIIDLGFTRLALRAGEQGTARNYPRSPAPAATRQGKEAVEQQAQARPQHQAARLSRAWRGEASDEADRSAKCDPGVSR